MKRLKNIEDKSEEFKITRVGDHQLPEWLKSKNNFNEAKKLVCDIRIDMIMSM